MVFIDDLYEVGNYMGFSENPFLDP